MSIAVGEVTSAIPSSQAVRGFDFFVGRMPQSDPPIESYHVVKSHHSAVRLAVSAREISGARYIGRVELQDS